MLMGTKWGVSPWWITEGEGKHVFSRIHMPSEAPALPRLAPLPPLQVQPIGTTAPAFSADFLRKHRSQR